MVNLKMQLFRKKIRTLNFGPIISETIPPPLVLKLNMLHVKSD